MMHIIEFTVCGMFAHTLKQNVVILTKFLSLAAPKVVKMTTFGAVSD